MYKYAQTDRRNEEAPIPILQAIVQKNVEFGQLFANIALNLGLPQGLNCGPIEATRNADRSAWSTY